MNLNGSGSSSVSGLALGFALLLLMFVAAFWLMRKTQGARSHGRQLFEVLASQSIGPAQQLQLVRVGDRTLLLGVCSQSISLLLSVDGDWPDLNGQTGDSIQKQDKGFTQLLQSMVSR